MLSVPSTALTAHLSPVRAGTGMGMLQATSAVAGVRGAIVGGWLVVHWGYQAILALAVAGLVLGLAFTWSIRSG